MSVDGHHTWSKLVQFAQTIPGVLTSIFPTLIFRIHALFKFLNFIGLPNIMNKEGESYLCLLCFLGWFHSGGVFYVFM
ncbi:hypothetical protein Pint_20512 [Pistacia integerrima]|uniref:Uncharacterized protein n=1 Tax=Pistacia integerrima TaxID=434235 RepID=A0ACC0XFP1_9ROSI|nr:hypothetical protein Pint_20512 [Pistacia integerrima]